MGTCVSNELHGSLNLRQASEAETSIPLIELGKRELVSPTSLRSSSVNTAKIYPKEINNLHLVPIEFTHRDITQEPPSRPRLRTLSGMTPFLTSRSYLPSLNTTTTASIHRLRLPL